MFQGKNRGFTIIEVLVAVAIIGVGFMGILTLAIQLVKAASYSGNRVIAINLAQEAMEVVRSIRDTNWLEGENWDAGLGITWSGNVNWNSDSITNTNDTLFINSTNFRYSHSSSGGTITPFSRHIVISNVTESFGAAGSVNFKRVKAIVEWSSGGVSYSEVLEDYLYPWQ